MSVRLNPYLAFPGTAGAAMARYAEVLGGTLTVSTFGEAGVEGVDPAGVMHAMLETPDGFTLMASDMPPGMPHERGNDVSISLSGDDEAKLRGWWDGLSEGGEITMPLERQLWGDVFGQCTDRFGVSWMVNIADGGA